MLDKSALHAWYVEYWFMKCMFDAELESNMCLDIVVAACAITLRVCTLLLIIAFYSVPESSTTYILTDN